MPLFNLSHLLESFLSNEVIPRSEPQRDPYGSYWLHRQDLGQPTAIRYGRIVDLIPYANTYKVQVDQQYSCWATPIVDTSLQPFGAKSLNTYTVGTGVFFFWYRGCHWGFILGAAPDFITDGAQGRSDFITNASRSGLFADRCHKEPFNTKYPAINNFSGGRPIDSTQGEWGAISATGLSIFLDDYMAHLKVDEETGIFGFYHDQLLRVAGHNLQHRSALREREEIDDQNELSMYSFSGPYSWERTGAFTWATTIHKELTAEGVISTPEYARFEPLVDDQQPFSRHLEFEGYLGQIRRELVALPPQPLPGDVNRQSVNKIFPGVFEEHVSMTGAYALASAKRISIRKRPIVSVPKLLIKPEDKRGDNDTNYKAGGLLGSGPDHLIKSELIEPVTTDEKCLLRASMLLDMGAFVFNWEGQHPFYYHQRDWYVPEDQESPVFTVLEAPDFTLLADNQYIDAPAPENMHVDHRYNNSKYWPTESGIDWLDDGSVVIFDGFGSEIKMTGGQIFISAPGDIFLQSGRNINNWAGRDFIAKAVWSADITTSYKDIRLKAENNLWALAGNNGCGGILLESRAECPSYNFCPNVGEDASHSGIFLKADNSRIVGWGGAIDLHSSVSDNFDGDITLNSNNHRIQLRSKYVDNIVTSAVFDIFVDGAQNTMNVNEWWAASSLVSTPLSIDGRVVVNNDIEVNGWVTTVNGFFASDQSSTYSGIVAAITDTTDIDANITTLTNRVSYLSTAGDSIVDIVNFETLAGTLDEVIFSLRTADQYKTADFKLYENKWQQMARLDSNVPATWTETPVITGCTGSNYTYPYPGRDPWTGFEFDPDILGTVLPTLESWREVNPALVDTPINIPKDRGAIYETPTYETPVKKVIDGNYPIIIDPAT